MEYLTKNWFVLAIALFIGYKFYKNRKIKKFIAEMKNKDIQLIDVRSEAEFQSGSSEKAINIPLQSIQQMIHKVSKSKPVLVCCASGSRSSMAVMTLKKAGIDAHNGGSWKNFV